MVRLQHCRVHATRKAVAHQCAKIFCSTRTYTRKKRCIITRMNAKIIFCFCLSNPAAIIHRLGGQKRFGIERENNSVLHRRRGLTLAHEEPASNVTDPNPDRALAWQRAPTMCGFFDFDCFSHPRTTTSGVSRDDRGRRRAISTNKTNNSVAPQNAGTPYFLQTNAFRRQRGGSIPEVRMANSVPGCHRVHGGAMGMR